MDASAALTRWHAAVESGAHAPARAGRRGGLRDDAGLIRDVTVMIRPVKGLHAVVEAMAVELTRAAPG